MYLKISKNGKKTSEEYEHVLASHRSYEGSSPPFLSHPSLNPAWSLFKIVVSSFFSCVLPLLRYYRHPPPPSRNHLLP